MRAHVPLDHHHARAGTRRDQGVAQTDDAAAHHRQIGDLRHVRKSPFT